MRKLNQTFGNVAYGAFSDSNNYATETNNFGETAFGILNKSTIDPDNFTSRDVVKSSKATLFSIGNGTEEERKNVIEIKGNGDVYINGVAGYTGTDTDQAGNIAEEFQGVHDSIDELDRRADETDVEIGEINQHLDNVDSTLDSIHIQKDDDSDLVYTLIVDGEERGTINIPKDQFLEDVSYDADTKELVFIFVTSDENNKEVRINIENIVDVYSAGNGLSLADGQFSIKLDPSTESYITVGADGLKVSGLNAKFDTLTQKDAELDGRILTAETDIDALLSDLSALKGDGEGSISNQILTAVDALKGDVSESYDTLKKIEDGITSTNDKFDEYLPLSGGTLTGYLFGEIGVFKGFTITLSLVLCNSIQCDLMPNGALWMIFDGDKTTSDELIHIYVDDDPNSTVNLYKSGIKFPNKTSSDLLHAAGGTTTLKTVNNNSLLGSGNINLHTIDTPARIFTPDDLNTFLLQGNVDYYYTVGGQNPANSPITGPYFSSLERAGELSYVLTVKAVRTNGNVREYIRGVYDIGDESPVISNWKEIAFVTDIQDITGSNTYTGANYISKETNLTDAVMQLDEEIKAANDNIDLEHANAEATYVKKAGDTMKGDLTVPNVVVTSNGAIDGRKLKIDNTGIDIIAPSGGDAYADTFLTIKDPTGENTIFNAFGVLSDSNVVGEGNQMAYVGGTHNTPTLSVFNTGLVGIGKSVANPPSEKLDVNGNVKATKFIGSLQGNADTATKATQDANGFNIASTYSKLITTPFAGTGLYDAEHPTLTDWLSSHRSYIGTFKGSGGTDDWTNVISSRHRNGDDDGNTYGMYISNRLLKDDVGTLRWDQQIAGVWQGEKVILDSSNYTDYIPTLEEITTQVTAKLVDGAPETLDTLNELAAALGDDPNFATTVTNQIAQKADKTTATTTTDGLMSATDKDQFDKLITSLSVLGPVSHMRDSSVFAQADGNVTFNYSCVDPLIGSATANTHSEVIPVATTTNAGVMSAADKAKLDGINISNYATQDDLDGYLPLSGGILTGTKGIKIQGMTNPNDNGEYYCMMDASGFVITSTSNLGTRIIELGRRSKRRGGLGYLHFYNTYGNIALSVNPEGIIITDKSETDLLNAAGGTTTLKTINGESLLGSGDITTPTPTVNAASGTKTIWTGTQSEYEAVTSKDANTLYFITEG